MDIEFAEAEALKEGIMWIRNNNITRAVFETGCASLVNRFKSRKEDLSIFSFRLKEIFKLLESFIDVKIEYVAYSSNRVADSFCKLAINK
ncbi:hypothetical protein Golob_025755 [Gossypium lobatum]|uniref:RNase H type-1 domain-containing protein n=1 Tax=Gossypium lobatum TaxID=34289 RepID=A0A7J8LT00_9ROSI|nr:hypothetical protein [Gossypium lobatum]